VQLKQVQNTIQFGKKKRKKRRIICYGSEGREKRGKKKRAGLRQLKEFCGVCSGLARGEKKLTSGKRRRGCKFIP